MHCKSSRKLINQLIDKQITSNDEEQLLLHISECEKCRNYYNKMYTMQRKLYSFSNSHEMPNKDFSSIVMESIEKKHKNKFNHKRNLIAKIAMAMTILIIFTLIPINSKSFATTISNIITKLVINDGDTTYNFKNDYKPYASHSATSVEMAKPELHKSFYTIDDVKKSNNTYLLLPQYVPNHYDFEYLNYNEFNKSHIEVILNYRKNIPNDDYNKLNTINIHISYNDMIAKPTEMHFDERTSLEKVKISDYDAIIGTLNIDKDSINKTIILPIPSKSMLIKLFTHSDGDLSNVLSADELVKVMESILTQI